MTKKIQKVLSNLGYGSRRSIEEMIRLGNIMINGKKAMIGQRLDEEKSVKIIISGKKIYLKKEKYTSKVLIYNKSEGEICTRYDGKNRPTVFKNLPTLNMQRWISVGRLDLNTRGLLLFTNDGDLAYKLMHPRYRIEREYYIRVFGKINQNIINILKNGVRIKNEIFSFKKIAIVKNIKESQNVWLKGILCQGKNREIRSMFEAVQCQVSRLIRIRYGNIVLPKYLKQGYWMQLNEKIVNHLWHLVEC